MLHEDGHTCASLRLGIMAPFDDAVNQVRHPIL
jgi:hypothetical protein